MKRFTLYPKQFPGYVLATYHGDWRVRMDKGPVYTIERWVGGTKDYEITMQSKHLYAVVEKLESLLDKRIGIWGVVDGKMNNLFDDEAPESARRRGSKFTEDERTQIIEMYYAEEGTGMYDRCGKVARKHGMISRETVKRFVREHENQRRQAA